MQNCFREVQRHIAVAEYLPEYPSASGNRVTIHYLLSHTSGIPSFTRLPNFDDQLKRNPFGEDFLMPKFETYRHIDAPISEVWAYISDVEKAPEWVVVMEELVQTSHNPVREGTTYRERSKIGPGESETEWHVTEFKPEIVQIHECEEPTFSARLTMALTQADRGTELDYRVQYQLMPVFRPLGWLIEKLFAERSMKQDLEKSLDNVKSMVERRE